MFLAYRIIEAPQGCVVPCQCIVYFRRTRIEFDRLQDFAFRARPVPIESTRNPSHRRVGLGKGLVERQRLVEGRPRARYRLRRRDEPPDRWHPILKTQPSMSLRVTGVEFHCQLKRFDSFLHTVGRELPVKEHSPKEGLVGLRIHRFLRSDAQFFLRRNGDAYGLGNGQGDLALELEDVFERTHVTFGPEVRVGGAVDELGRDAYLVAHLEYGPFYQRIDAQFSRDLGQRLVGVLVAHGRSTRDDSQRADFRQLGNQRLGHPVDKILLLRIARDVRKGQHGDLLDGLLGNCIGSRCVLEFGLEFGNGGIIDPPEHVDKPGIAS